MSIKNIQNDNNKSWLDAKFGSINAKQTNVNAGVTFKMDAGSKLILQGAEGNIGDKLELNASLEPIWIPDEIGEEFQFAEFLESSTFSTTSNTLVQVPATFTTTDLGATARNYVLFFGIEMDNSDPGFGGGFGELRQTTPGPTTYNNFTIVGNLLIYHNMVGYLVLTLSGVNSFDFYIRSGTGGQQTQVQRVRYVLYRIS